MNELIFQIQLLSVMFFISFGLNVALLAWLITDGEQDNSNKVKKEE